MLKISSSKMLVNLANKAMPNTKVLRLVTTYDEVTKITLKLEASGLGCVTFQDVFAALFGKTNTGSAIQNIANPVCVTDAKGCYKLRSNDIANQPAPLAITSISATLATCAP